MKPLELCNLPEKLNRVGTYINGASINLKNPVFVANRKMYLPVKQVAERLDISIKGADPRIELITDTDSYLVSAGIYENGKTELNYALKVVDGVMYTEAAFWAEKLGVSFAWEAETCSLYVTTVLLYDGYRIAPKEIFAEDEGNRLFHGMYLYVDGTVESCSNGVAKIATENGHIYLVARFQRVTAGDKNRFCFAYNAGEYLGGCPTGNLMEVVPQENRYRVGKILYTEESWKSFEKEEKSPITTSKSVTSVPAEEHKDWKQPTLCNPTRFGDFVYLQPLGWNSRPASEPYEGIYYYPYNNAEDGMIWVSRVPNPAKTTGEYFPYNALLVGMCQGDINNLVNDEETKVAGIRGRKINYRINVNNIPQELDAYILPRPDYVYILTFGEKNSLSKNMHDFEEEFTQKMKRS